MHTCLLPNLELGSQITAETYKDGIGFGFGNIPGKFFDLGSNLELEDIITNHWNSSRTHYQIFGGAGVPIIVLVLFW